MNKIFFFLGVTMQSFISAFAQPGSPDPHFGNNGIVVTSFFPDKHTEAQSVLIQKDGKILVTGSTEVPNSFSVGVLMRLQTDGSLDTLFNGGNVFLPFPDMNNYAITSVVQPDHKIVTLMRLGHNAQDSIALVRLNTDGSVDHSFGTNGWTTLDLGKNYQGPKDMAIQNDGSFVIAGYTGNQGDTFDIFFAARFLHNGSLDNSFGYKGVVTTHIGESWTNVSAVLIQPDGKIIVSGYAVFEGFEHLATARYLHNGALDPAFGDSGIVITGFDGCNSRSTGAVLQPDGKIVLSGYKDPGNGDADFIALRYTSEGDLDHTFHGDGIAQITVSTYADHPHNILLQPDNKIVLGGYAHSNFPSGGSNMALVRLMENGLPDFSFDGDGVVDFPASPDNSDVIYDMGIAPSGEIIAAGLIRVDFQNRMGVVKFLSGLTVGMKDEESLSALLKLYPNPASDQISLEYDLLQNEMVSIDLLDFNGRVVQTLLPRSFRSSGMHFEMFNIEPGLSTGHYYIKIITETAMRTEKVLVLNN